jgi:malate dehydrogenase (oxaloacetate-decarboxylating)
MEDYKRIFAHPREALVGWPSAAGAPHLLETVERARATVLLGLSGQPRAFEKDVVVAMARNTARPVIFALSNPTSSAEAVPEDLLAWTSGAALVATGSPFAPVDVAGKAVAIGQGNNAFIFPGLGFGAILSGATEVTGAMVLDAAYALAEFTQASYPASVYPPVSELQRVSMLVAERVYLRAVKDGVATAPARTPDEVRAHIASRFYRPEYLPTVRG